MEVDMRPTEQYSDIGGLDKQIQELVEAVVLPMTHKERFENIGIKPPKGTLNLVKNLDLQNFSLWSKNSLDIVKNSV